MRIILKKDVSKVGQRLDVKEVPDGYASNFLIPNGLAIPATKENLAMRDREVATREETKNKELELVKAHFKKVGDEALVIEVPANDQGHLFKAVTAKTISQELKARRDIDLPEEAIILTEPIKSLGPHEVTLSYKDKKQKLHLLVEKIK